jgi:hypothetical protein
VLTNDCVVQNNIAQSHARVERRKNSKFATPPTHTRPNLVHHRRFNLRGVMRASGHVPVNAPPSIGLLFLDVVVRYAKQKAAPIDLCVLGDLVVNFPSSGQVK